MVIAVYLCAQPEPPHSFLLLGILAKKRKDNLPLRFEHKESTISESLQCWLVPFPHMPQNEGNLIRGFLPLAEQCFGSFDYFIIKNPPALLCTASPHPMGLP